MPYPITFRTEIFRKVLHSLDPEEQALMRASLDEIDGGDLVDETVLPLEDAELRSWDAAFLSIFDGALYIKHWSRPFRDFDDPTADMKRVAELLSPDKTRLMDVRWMQERLQRLVDTSAIGTIFFVAIAVAIDGTMGITLWRHPQLSSEDARLSAKIWLANAFERS